MVTTASRTNVRLKLFSTMTAAGAASLPAPYMLAASVPPRPFNVASMSSTKAMLIDGEVVMLSDSRYESIVETAAILEDANTLAAIKASEAEVNAGNIVAWDDLKAELGL